MSSSSFISLRVVLFIVVIILHMINTMLRDPTAAFGVTTTTAMDDIISDCKKIEQQQPQQQGNETSTSISSYLFDYEDTTIPDLSENIPTHPRYSIDNIPPIKVGLCVITKEADRYLDEWIDYHLLALQFHEIYIYDNTDDYMLQEWSRKKRQGYSTRIHVIHYPGRTHQVRAYNNCTKQYGKRNDYLAYWDDDEYMVLYKHDFIWEFVRDHLIHGTSLTINWRIFGHCNHTHYSPLPVTKRFQYHNETRDQVKSIVRPQDIVRMISPHAAELRDYVNITIPGEDRGWRDTSGIFANYSELGNKNYDRPQDVAVIYHFRFKSLREWYWKSCVRLRWGTLHHPYHTCGLIPWAGQYFDDTPWQILKNRVPKYAIYDDWVDYS